MFRTDNNDTDDNDGDRVCHDQCFILRGSNIHHDYFTNIISHVINNWPITTYSIRSKGKLGNQGCIIIINSE